MRRDPITDEKAYKALEDKELSDIIHVVKNVIIIALATVMAISLSQCNMAERHLRDCAKMNNVFECEYIAVVKKDDGK